MQNPELTTDLDPQVAIFLAVPNEIASPLAETWAPWKPFPGTKTVPVSTWRILCFRGTGSVFISFERSAGRPGLEMMRRRWRSQPSRFALMSDLLRVP